MWMVALGLGLPTLASAGEVLTFEDGYRAVVHEIPGARTVAVRTAFGRGWNADPDTLPGAAHLMEHLWFRARLQTGGAPLYERFQAQGCVVNGFTTPDRTRFITTCPTDSVALLLDAHTALVSQPMIGVSPAEVAIENRVVRFEETERNGWAIQGMRLLLSRLLPADHPTHAVWAAPDLERDPVSSEAIAGWAAEAHVPSEAVLVVAGAVDAEAVVERLVEAHGPVNAAGDAAVRDRASAEAPAPVKRSGPNLSLPSPVSGVMLGWTLPPRTSSAVGDAIADRIGGGLANALEDSEAVLSVGCGYESQETIDLLTCTVLFEVDADLPAQGGAVVDAVEEVVSEGLGKDARRAIIQSLLESKPKLESSLRASEAVPASVAERLESEVLALGRVRSVDTMVTDLSGWRPASSVREALRWIRVERMAHIRFEPDDVAFVLDDAAPSPAPPAPAAVPAAAITLEDAPAATRTLPNGLQIVAVQEARAVRTLASLRFGGGRDRFPNALGWVAERVTGSPAHRASKGIGTGESVGRDHTELFVFADPGKERAGLRRLRGMAIRRFPGFSEENRDRIERMIDRVLAGREAASRDALGIASQDLLDAIVPAHAPSHGPSSADLEAMRKVGPGAMVAYLAQTYQPANAVLTLTGPQAPTELIELAEELFAPWAARPGVAVGSPMRAPKAGPPTSIRAFYKDSRRSTASVAWMCRLPDGTRSAMASVLEEILRTRAWSVLRAESGRTYTPRVSVVTWPDGTATLSIGVGTRAREVGLVLDAVDEMLVDPDAAELSNARWGTLRRLMVLRDSQVSTESAVFSAISLGQDPTAPFAAVREPIDAISLDQVGRSLGRCRDTAGWTVTGPPLAEQILQEAGRTPVEAP